jgi:uncharacterized protein (TIGR03437 family)
MLAQAPPTILDIQAENRVSYFHDIWDYSKIASDPGIAKALRPIKPFQSAADINDIVAVNGKPAKGTWVNRCDPQVGLDPNAVHGAPLPRAIADVKRSCMIHHYFEILQADGTPIGTIMVSGMNGGDPPPGSPSVIARDNLTVVGGTGAFLGARGQAGNVNALGAASFRITSISEDPANRRLNGGQEGRFIIYLIPMSRPRVVSVFHAAGFPLVSEEKPASVGETLTLIASGLGPTRPGVDPGQPFTADPLQVVNSPVEVLVNGTSGEVLSASGVPGAVDRYQVTFRLPASIAPGAASLQVTSAWIAGPEVKIAIQQNEEKEKESGREPF